MSRNKREGKYAGKAKDYSCHGFKHACVKHWRTGFGPYAYSSLKETSKFYKSIGVNNFFF